MKNFLYYFKIKSLLSKSQVKRFNFFIYLTLITMLLELIGIGMVVPFLKLLSGNSTSINIKYIENFSHLQTVSLVLATLLFVITVKVGFVSYFNYVIYNYYTELKVSLSEKIYRIYLKKPYEHHLLVSSSELIRNIDDIKWFVDSVKYLLSLIAETIMVIGIFTFILFYEPIGAITTFLILGTAGYFIYKTIQNKAKFWGEKRRTHDQFRLLYLQQGFHAIKDIKVMNKEDTFINRFSFHNKVSTNYEYKHIFIQSLPRLLLELLTIFGIAFLIITIFIQYKEISRIVPTLGLFIAAVYRLMPSITRIMNSIQSINWGAAVIESLVNEFNIEHEEDKHRYVENKKIFFDKSIELKNINFKYKNTKRNILSNINLKIKFGESVGFLGSSGVGKTTLLNIILGLLKTNSGEVLVDDKNINEGVGSWQKQIGYVSQSVYLSDDTLKKNIAFGAEDERDIIDKNINKAIKDSQLERLIKVLSNGLETKVGEFGERISGGERQRVGIARALYNNPKLLILDESTNSLDMETEDKILNDINSLKKSKTIIMISHRLRTLFMCDRIFKLTNLKLEELEKK